MPKNELDNDVGFEKKKNGRPTKAKRKKQYTLTMDEDLHDEVVSMAENMQLSFSSYISMILKKSMQNGDVDG